MLNRQNASNKDLVQAVDVADRTGSIVTEQVASVIQAAEAKAEEIRRDAEREAYGIRKEASDAANRVIEGIDAIEGPLGELVAALRHESVGPGNGHAGASGPVDVEPEAIGPRSAIDDGAAETLGADQLEALRAVGEPPSVSFDEPDGAASVAAGEPASPVLEEIEEVPKESPRRSRQKGTKRSRQKTRRKAAAERSHEAAEPEAVASEDVHEAADDDPQGGVAETQESAGPQEATESQEADELLESAEVHEAIADPQPDATAEQPEEAATPEETVEAASDEPQETAEPHETTADPQPDAAAEDPEEAASESSREELIEDSATEVPELETEDQLTTDDLDTAREDDTRAPEAPTGEAADEERHEREDDQRRVERPGGTPSDGSSSTRAGSAGASAWKGALTSKRSRLRGRFGGSRETPFITTEGECAACRRTLQVESEEALAESDWLVNGDVGLCPDCQSQGWQLPEGARLPFRRGGT